MIYNAELETISQSIAQLRYSIDEDLKDRAQHMTFGERKAYADTRIKGWEETHPGYSIIYTLKIMDHDTL